MLPDYRQDEGYSDKPATTQIGGRIAVITINRPQVAVTFRPLTVKEMIQALDAWGYDDNIGVIVPDREGDKLLVPAAIRKSAATMAAIR